MVAEEVGRLGAGCPTTGARGDAGSPGEVVFGPGGGAVCVVGQRGSGLGQSGHAPGGFG